MLLDAIGHWLDVVGCCWELERKAPTSYLSWCVGGVQLDITCSNDILDFLYREFVYKLQIEAWSIDLSHVWLCALLRIAGCCWVSLDVVGC